MNLIEATAFFETNRGAVNEDIWLKYGRGTFIPDQLPSEWLTLMEYYADLNAKNIIEIGTHTGGSLWYFIKHAAPGARVISIDIDHDLCQMWSEFTTIRPDVEVIKLTGDSTDPAIIAKARELMPEVDFVFIDGNHFFPYSQLDWDNYGQHAKSCAMHDIGCGEYPQWPQEVRRVWNSIVESKPGKTAELIFKDGTKAAYGIGIIER